MKFNDIFTEEKYNNHLEWLRNYENGKQLDLSGADLTHANLSYSILDSVDLYYANLTGANLRGAVLTRVNLYRANLTDAILSLVNLTNVNLIGANLTCANLTCANLCAAILSGANLTGANLTGADLTNIIFKYCIGDGVRIKNLDLPIYEVILCDNQLAIGCKQYSVDDWYNFNDATINRMDDGALEWWGLYKDTIKEWISA